MIMTNTTRLFWVFGAFHIALWTLIPLFLHPNGHLDVLEGIEWGRHFAWGYDKHPPLAPWLTYVFYWVGGKSLWSVYFFSQVLVVMGQWHVFKLGKEMVGPRTAFMASFCLEGIFYYTHTSLKFNPDA